MAPTSTQNPIQTFSIPTVDGDLPLELFPGRTTTFVGANGSGKTRLATFLETKGISNVHRIAAHRALNLNASVNKIPLDHALATLETGITHATKETVQTYREGHRWGGRAEIHLLNDYDPLLQVLFAEQSNTTLKTHRQARFGLPFKPDKTKFEKLEQVWNSVLPHRQLVISGDTIKAKTPDSETEYSAANMSDGERAVFYLIAQVLAFDTPKILIFDEPELHLHRSIMEKLWDALEAARPDCSFLLITHDLEFAASRRDKKFLLDSYDGSKWQIRPIEDSYFDEETTTRILGGRRPVLFVEGGVKSLDRMIYSACYPEWQILQWGGSSSVRRAVTEMRKCSMFNRLRCAGIIDADDLSSEESEKLHNNSIYPLNVSEVENILALPDICKAIAKAMKYNDNEANSIIQEVKQKIFEEVNNPELLSKAAMRYVRRRVDRHLKAMDIPGGDCTLEELDSQYRSHVNQLDIPKIHQQYHSMIQTAISTDDLPLLLRYYDSKALVSKIARAFDYNYNQFESWLLRTLRTPDDQEFINAIRNVLPFLPDQ